MAQDIGISPAPSKRRQIRPVAACSRQEIPGISNATISLIESSKLNPSVAVLKRILDGIPMHLSAFFDGRARRVRAGSLPQ